MTSTQHIWVATALLHYENPSRKDFTVAEIVARAVAEHPSGGFRVSLANCAISDGVATIPPALVRSCVLTATRSDRRRLFRVGDAAHPERMLEHAHPGRTTIPSQYRYLVDWYEGAYTRHPVAAPRVHFATGAA